MGTGTTSPIPNRPSRFTSIVRRSGTKRVTFFLPLKCSSCRCSSPRGNAIADNSFVKLCGTLFLSAFSKFVLRFHLSVTLITRRRFFFPTALLFRHLHNFCANRIIVLNYAELLAFFPRFPQTFPRLCAKLNRSENIFRALRYCACYVPGRIFPPSILTHSIR